MKSSFYRVCAFFAAMCLFAQIIMFAVACGGDGGETNLTTETVSNQIATATTTGRMESSYGDALRLTLTNQAYSPNYPFAVQLPDEAFDVFVSAQLHLPEANYPTLAAAFATINNAQIPRLRFTFTAAQLAAQINSRLPAAYASPNTPANGLLVLLSSRPGHIPAAAPTLDPNTTLSPVQVFMLVQYLAQEQRNRSACTIACDVAYYAALGVIAAATAACAEGTGFIGTAICAALGAAAADAASQAHNSCLTACHNSGNG